MVGIVVVSHSKYLAEATCNLARQAASSATLCGVGGTGENNEEFGTDATQIMEAIQQVYSDEGVLVLLDLGSALLSAETALALLGDDIASKVKICPAPLVEGTISAAIQASINADLDTIYNEALKSLEPKLEQLGVSLSATSNGANTNGESSSTTHTTVTVPSEALSNTYTIYNEHGLHARPAAKIVQVLSRFDAEVYLSHIDKPENLVSTSSLNAIAKLNVRKGDVIRISTWGTDAQKVITEWEQLIEDNFGENAVASPNKKTDKNLVGAGSASEISKKSSHNNADGAIDYNIEEKLKVLDTDEEHTSREDAHSETSLIVASQGMVIAKSLCLLDTQPKFLDTIPEGKSQEKKRFDALYEQMCSILEKEKDDLKSSDNSNLREIIEMYSVLARDPELQNRVIEKIEQNDITCEFAWWKVCNEIAEEYRGINNEYLNARSEDLIDIGKRLLRLSTKVFVPSISFNDISNPSVLFIEEITPEIMSKINPTIIKGIVSKLGSGESHAAIIAKTINIPMICGFDEIAQVKNDETVIIDTSIPKIFIAPSDKEIQAYNNTIEKNKEFFNSMMEKANVNAHTQDKRAISCFANIGNISDVDYLNLDIVDGVGLFRTEFLFLNRGAAPREEEQYQIYLKVFRMFKDKPVVVRVMDIGGDKPISYLSMLKEDNPFLGIRGIRFTLKHKKLLQIQISALLRAAAHTQLRIMLPMVIDEQEIIMFKSILKDVSEVLKQAKIDFCTDVKVGIMIETPAAIIRSTNLNNCVDFFSIGTNDLTQYILAVERGNINVSYLYDCCHPAVLQSIASLLSSNKNADISICGEMGADIEAVPLLVGMGIQKLSMSAAQVPKIKYLIHEIKFSECKKLVENALRLSTAKEIRSFVYTQVPIVQLLKKHI